MIRAAGPGLSTSRPTRAAGWVALLALFAMLAHALAACSSPSGSDCARSAEALEAALAAASAGDAIDICPNTEIAGNFRVPSGVVLQGGSESTLSGTDGPLLFIEPGAADSPTRVRSVQLRVEPSDEGTPAGLVVSGPGPVELLDLHIELRAGIGILLSDPESVRGARIRVHGQPPSSLEGERRIRATEAPVAGLVAEGVASCAGFHFDHLEIARIVGVGVALRDACEGSTLSQSAIRDIVGTGILVESGAPELEEILTTGIRGRSVVASDAVSYGIAIVDGADVRMRSTALIGVADAALLVDGATLDARGIAVFGAQGPGLYANRSTLTLEGALIRGTLDTGISLRASAADLRQTWIAETEAAAILGDAGRIAWTGDGVRVFGAEGMPTAVTTSEMTIGGSPRAGLVGAAEATVNGAEGNLLVCDQSVLESDWACRIEEDGREVCVRGAAPSVPQWSCSWEGGGMRCIGPADGEEPPLTSENAPLPGACLDAMDTLLREPAMEILVDGMGDRTPDMLSPRGIIGENGTLGFREADLLPGSTSVERALPWQCADVEGGRSCLLPDTNDLTAPAPFHPGGLRAAAWRCRTASDGRTCTRESIAAGLIEEASLAPDLVLVANDALAERSRRALVAPPELEFRRAAQPGPSLSGRALLRADGQVRELVSSPQGLEVGP